MARIVGFVILFVVLLVLFVVTGGVDSGSTSEVKSSPVPSRIDEGFSTLKIN